MRRMLRAKLLASALVISVVPLAATAVPAFAQMDAEVSFDSFHDQLSQYGYWGYSDRWGLVWQPGDVAPDFRPYDTNGHWDYTDEYGWYWSSGYPWGDVAFHFGRWVNDPDDGWLWLPGYTWSPGWVVWRSNGRYVGWMPAPPDSAFLEGRGDIEGGTVSFGWNNDPYYGYRNWYGPEFDARRFADNWTFVGIGQLADPDYSAVVVRNPELVLNIIRQTRNMRNYAVENNYVVNRGIDIHLVERAAGHPIRIEPARAVIRHPAFVTTVDVGRRVQMQQRTMMPHGTGLANSAPPPPQAIVNKLSTSAASRNGRVSAHLFTRTTIDNPEAQSRFHGMPARGNQPGTGPAGMNGPNNPAETRHREEGPPGTAPGGMNGPAGMNGPNNPAPGETRRHEENPPGSGPGGMNGPGGMSGPNNPAPGETRRHEENPPAPGGMNGPGGINGPDNPAPGETRHRDEGPGGPGSMSGPAGPEGQPGPSAHRVQGPPPGMRPVPPSAPPAAERQPPNGDNTKTPPEKKHKPDEPPPGTPQ